ncbi:hypothetical protein CRE_27875 [Caenorhabditis remanei]|uniref:Uncharacterized protein n=1 Tax=Caenorhabditis remanei TaxID=31234 RepID=E3NG91_CAERE|nr:hypothetical protein CRE_27875 [Caenorhabditis remanei]
MVFLEHFRRCLDRSRMSHEVHSGELQHRASESSWLLENGTLESGCAVALAPLSRSSEKPHNSPDRVPNHGVHQYLNGVYELLSKLIQSSSSLYSRSERRRGIGRKSSSL